MNKYNLAKKIEHALKEKGFKKKVTKGSGWKGRGNKYYTTGFVIGTGLKKCVVVGYYVTDFIPLKLYFSGDLSDMGKKKLERITNKTKAAIEEYKQAMSGFVFEERISEYGMPYLVVTGEKESAK